MRQLNPDEQKAALAMLRSGGAIDCPKHSPLRHGVNGLVAHGLAERVLAELEVFTLTHEGERSLREWAARGERTDQ